MSYLDTLRMSQQGDPFAGAPVDPRTFTRGTSQREIDAFNAWMRNQPWWQNTLAGSNGFDGRQQEAVENFLKSSGAKIDGLHIDNGGNINQKNHTLRNVGIGAAIGGLALTGVGLAGVGPLAGVLGASTAAPALAGTAATVGGGAAAAAPAAAGGGWLAGLGGALASPGIGAGISAGTNLLGTYMTAKSNDKATQAQLAGADKALAFEKEQFDYQKHLAEPYLATGASGNDRMSGYLADPFKLPTAEEISSQPGYEFGLAQGVRARDISGAARGTFANGRSIAALDKFGQDYAMTKSNEYIDQLLSARKQNVGEAQSSIDAALRASALTRPA